jgi:hypothetical protein
MRPGQRRLTCTGWGRPSRSALPSMAHAAAKTVDAGAPRASQKTFNPIRPATHGTDTAQ